jgi:hypothetical protein
MWRTAGIALKFNLFELRNGDAKGLLYAPEAGSPSPLWNACNLLQKIASEGIIRTADRTIGLTYKLGHQMEVSDGTEEHYQIAKRLVDIDLLEVRLRQPLRIGGVVLVRPTDQLLLVSTYALPADTRATLVVLIEGDLVFPRRTACIFVQLDRYLHVRVFSRGQASNTADAAALRMAHSFAKATTRYSKIPKEAKYIQKIGFPRSVRPHQKDAIPDAYVHSLEVLPVPQA